MAPPTTQRVIGQSIERHQQVGSTNDMLRARAKTGAPEGLIITAEEQTAGRGRTGRGWRAPLGTSLLMSILLRPTWLAPEAAFTITMLAATALCRAVEIAVPGLAAALKWPNDLLLPATPEVGAPLRKAAGILSELALADGQIDYVVLGVGVNVNWSPSGIVDGRDLASLATSISAAAGGPVDRDMLLEVLVEQLDTRYRALRRGQHETIFTAWRNRLATLGQDVTVVTPSGTLRGVAEAVNLHGALLLRDTTGTAHTITAGDVHA